MSISLATGVTSFAGSKERLSKSSTLGTGLCAVCAVGFFLDLGAAGIFGARAAAFFAVAFLAFGFEEDVDWDSRFCGLTNFAWKELVPGMLAAPTVVADWNVGFGVEFCLLNIFSPVSDDDLANGSVRLGGNISLKL